MRILTLTLSVLALGACSGRQVEVHTGAEPAAEVALHLVNNLSQPVNVYVVSGGNDIFVKQVGSNAVEHIPISGVAAGSTVNLRAVTVDGTRTYTKNNVTLSSMYEWRLP
jgi:phosphoribosylformylglycinamidine (FGAM) synthase-like amidotransferase family enzyme